jgi:hypothetical protein
LEREGVSNFSPSPCLIVDVLILNTSDGSTALNEIQGDVCVSVPIRMTFFYSGLEIEADFLDERLE